MRMPNGRAWLLVGIVAVGGCLGGNPGDGNTPVDAAMPGDLAVANDDDLAGQPPQDLAGVDVASAPDLACAANVQSDGENCGRCGHSCGGGACNAGICQPVVLATPPSAASALEGIFSDGVHVYYASCAGNGGGGSPTTAGIFRLSVNGAAQTPSPVQAWANASSAAACPAQVTVNGATAYWAEYSATLWQGPAAGGAATNIFTVDFNYTLNHLATNPAGTHVFVSLSETDTNTSRIFDCTSSCTTVYTVANTQSVISAVADASYVYWAESGGSSHIYRLPIGATTSTAPTDLGGANVSSPRRVRLDGAGYIYWQNVDDVIYRSTVTTSNPQMVVSTGSGGDFVADATNVYWHDGVNTRLRYAPSAGGGTGTDLATAAGGVEIGGRVTLANDSAAVYWINQTAGSISKIALP